MTDDDSGDAQEVDEGTSPGTGGGATGLMGRLSGLFGPPGARRSASAPPPSPGEVERGINFIDPTERKIGLVGAALAAVIGLLTFVPYIEKPKSGPLPTATPGTDHTCPSDYRYLKVSGRYTCQSTVHYPASHWVEFLIITLVFAAVTLVAVRIGRRALLAFVLVMTGFALETVAAQTILSIPFIVAGGWLVVRAWRVQKYGDPSASAAARGAKEKRAAAKGGTAPAGTKDRGSTTGAKAGAGKAAAPAAPTGRRGRKQPVTTPAGRAPATASKRYTPPAPKRKKPPPPDKPDNTGKA